MARRPSAFVRLIELEDVMICPPVRMHSAALMVVVAREHAVVHHAATWSPADDGRVPAGAVVPRRVRVAPVSAPPQELSTLAPDAYVDQRSARVDKSLYLRLARGLAFPSRKIGKRIVARWSDVQAALGARPAEGGPDEARRDVESLDDLRLRLGLAPRGGA